MTAEQNLVLLAHEAFIRRASQLGLPFMLKGSYLTRQYFPQLTERIPQDLDWVYMPLIESAEQAQAIFTDWATRATELPLDDGVVFRSFRENAFWRMIDYAMADDFPTINTDLHCWVAGQAVELLGVDVSFNLPLDVPSEPLRYRPLRGEPFLLEHTAPLALQAAWKLHQTLVRPRFKDLFDLLHLVKHATFTPACRQQALVVLDKECRADNTDLAQLRWLLAGDLAPLFTTPDVARAWQAWRHSHAVAGPWFYEQAASITDAARLPETLAAFQEQLRVAFTSAGFDAAQLSTFGASSRVVPAAKRGLLDKLRAFFG